MWFFPDIHRQTIVSNLKPAYGQIDINALPQGVYFYYGDHNRSGCQCCKICKNLTSTAHKF